MNKPSNTNSIPTKTNISSIEHLRIYQLASSLEDKLYQLSKQTPSEKYYPLGNDVRRSGAAVAHYISETHRRYSYAVKIECLHAARTAAEEAIRHLELVRAQDQTDVSSLIEDYNSLIRQCWGLIKYLKNKQATNMVKDQVRAADELVAARG